MTDWLSSYEENNYGDLFYSLIRVYKPNTVIELGTKAGYSAYHIARGLTDNGKGKLYCYDLWEKYSYSSVPKKTAEKKLKKYKRVAQFKLTDAVHLPPKSCDILHVDLSNEGELLEKVLPRWLKKVRMLIIIEGGSGERDKVAWMVKYKKMPVKSWLKKFARRYKVTYLTINPFPSITLITVR